jgi:hypothetical protein
MLVALETRQTKMRAKDPSDRRATFTHLDANLRKALSPPRRSWAGIIAGLLAKWVRGPRALRRPRWYDGDGAHRGF